MNLALAKCFSTKGIVWPVNFRLFSSRTVFSPSLKIVLLTNLAKNKITNNITLNYQISVLRAQQIFDKQS